MSYTSDLTDEQWALLEPVFNDARRLAKSFENTTTSATGWLQVACIASILRHLSRAGKRALPAAA